MRGALGGLRPPTRLRRWLNHGFERVRDGPFRRLVETALAWRYTTLAAALGTLILSLGVIFGGRVGFVFFSGPEAGTVYANLVWRPAPRGT